MKPARFNSTFYIISLILILYFIGSVPGLNTTLFAQAPDTLWTKTYGRPERDEAKSIQETSDGGFIIAGYSEILDQSTGYIQWKLYLLKTDEFGDTLWTKIYGSYGHHVGNFVQETSDGGFVIAGGVTLFTNNVNAYLIKTDASGNLLWEKSIGGPEYDEGNCVRETFDGGFIIAGYTESYGAGSSDFYLIKTDGNGNTLWEKTFGSPRWEESRSLVQTADSGFVIVGYKIISSSSGGPDTDVYLIKTDSNGDTLWTRLFDTQEGYYTNEGWAVEQTGDGGYIIAGETQYPGRDAYLIKTDANGNAQWMRTFDKFGSSEIGRSVCQTQDGGYLMAGYTNFVGPLLHDVFLVRTDANGDSLWTKVLGRNIGTFKNDEAFAALQTSDGGYIVAGFGWNYPISDSDVYLIKLAPEAVVNIDDRADAQLPHSFALHQNFPNPFNPTTTIEYSIPQAGRIHLEVFNILGEKVATLVNEFNAAGNYELEFNAADLSSGIYFYKLQAGAFIETKKMVIMK